LEKETDKPTENTIGKNKGGRPAGLTNRQREFAKFYVDGRWSNAECARKAGYAEGSAAQHAAKLLDGKSFPDVPELIKELRQARERKYGVTLINQLKRFDELSRAAEDAGQFSAAINAEKIRSSLGGLTIDRRESTHVHQLDNMSRDDIVARLAALRKQYPNAFPEPEMKRVEDAKNRAITVDIVEAEFTEKDPLPAGGKSSKRGDA
jgi:phage terminase small subunit